MSIETEAAPKRSRGKSAPIKGRTIHLGEVFSPLAEAESAATGETPNEVILRRLDRDYRANPTAPVGRKSGRKPTRPLPSPESFSVVIVVADTPTPEAN